MEHELFLKIIGLSEKNQTEIAQILGIKQQQISSWVNGNRKPKLSAILELAEKLGYEITFEIKPKC